MSELMTEEWAKIVEKLENDGLPKFSEDRRPCKVKKKQKQNFVSKGQTKAIRGK